MHGEHEFEKYNYKIQKQANRKSSWKYGCHGRDKHGIENNEGILCMDSDPLLPVYADSIVYNSSIYLNLIRALGIK